GRTRGRNRALARVALRRRSAEARADRRPGRPEADSRGAGGALRIDGTLPAVHDPSGEEADRVGLGARRRLRPRPGTPPRAGPGSVPAALRVVPPAFFARVSDAISSGTDPR